MDPSSGSGDFQTLSKVKLERMVLEVAGILMEEYVPGRDRVITPENVYQPARPAGREHLLHFLDKTLLKPGSRFEGLENLDRCLEDMEAGRQVIFLPEHRGNFDAYTFDLLLSREDIRYRKILDRLIFIAGRKLNESSDLVKMFTEKYPRLVIVPRRDYPPAVDREGPEDIREREDFEKYAARINFAAFRQLLRLKKTGHIFVLYPLGGRLKPDAENQPVRETTSYMQRFDTAYLISMEGNTLPPAPNMEDERPIQDKVIFRVGKPLDCKTFLRSMKSRFAGEEEAKRVPAGSDWERFAVGRIMNMLEHLRLYGNYGEEH